MEKLEEIIVPEDLSTRLMCQALMKESDMLTLPAVVDILNSDKFKKEIESGRVTIAMLKPDLALDAKMPEGKEEFDEDKRCKFLLEQIKAPLEVKFKIALPLDGEFISEWYSDGAKNRQLAIEPIEKERYGVSHEKRWHEFIWLMKNRTNATFVILYSPDGNAVDEWNGQMGRHWDVDKLNDKGDLVFRTIFTYGTHNNLTHGSSDKEAVKREVPILVKLIQRYMRNSLKKS